SSSNARSISSRNPDAGGPTFEVTAVAVDAWVAESPGRGDGAVIDISRFAPAMVDSGTNVGAKLSISRGVPGQNVRAGAWLLCDHDAISSATRTISAPNNGKSPPAQRSSTASGVALAAASAASRA